MGTIACHTKVFWRALPLTACLVCFALPAGAAGAYCSPPRLPACITEAGGFEDERAARSCRSDFETYLSAIERQANCVMQVAEEQARQRIEDGRRDADDIRDEAREAVTRFDCKVDGRALCY